MRPEAVADPAAVLAAFDKIAATRPELEQAGRFAWAYSLGGSDEELAEALAERDLYRADHVLGVAEAAGWTWNANRRRFVRSTRARLPYVAVWAAAAAVMILAGIVGAIGGPAAGAATGVLSAAALVVPAVVLTERRRRTT